ncbi:unnamed protein product [Dovyalis caffra]|uniref:Uncharacterized protein n=1 Tax=Dovyalis caffra TaxID=77055 RepID=A0AAV1QSV2_9ROSI|nr:unnamed protein product [Dovyalis caffra]
MRGGLRVRELSGFNIVVNGGNSSGADELELHNPKNGTNLQWRYFYRMAGAGERVGSLLAAVHVATMVQKPHKHGHQRYTLTSGECDPFEAIYDEDQLAWFESEKQQRIQLAL